MNLPRTLLAAQDGSHPENQRHHETWRTLVQPWWNLPRNLLAAQEGSASENHRESESYSTPKPLLWLKTQKLLLLGKKYTSKYPFERTSTAHQNHNFIFTPIVNAVRPKTLNSFKSKKERIFNSRSNNGKRVHSVALSQSRSK